MKDETRIELLKRFELIRLVAGRDPESEREARTTLEGREAVAQDAVFILKKETSN